MQMLKCKFDTYMKRQSNAGKKSNLLSGKEDFQQFVDSNSQRSLNSTGPTSYFLSKFTSFQTPKHSVKNYEENVKQSVVGEFTRAQKNWVNKDPPMVQQQIG